MGSNTLTRAHLADVIYKKANHSHVESKDLVESILNLVKQAIRKDNSMLVTGFGKFEVFAKHARPGRNPKTNESMTLAARKVVVFRLSKKFRAELNHEGEGR